MKACLSTFWRRLSEIPSVLRAFTVGYGIFGFLAIVMTIIPTWKAEDGSSRSIGDVWATGDGPLVLCLGLVMLSLAFVSFKGYRWSRPVLVVAVGSGIIWNAQAWWEDALSIVIYLVASGLTIALTVWYLYFKSDVEIFFMRGTEAGSEETSSHDP